MPRGLTRPNAAAEDTKSISKANKKPEWQWEESEDAVKAYAVLAGLLALGALPITHANQIADLPCKRMFFDV